MRRLCLFLNRLEGAEKARADASFLGLAEVFDLQPYTDSSFDGFQDALFDEAAPSSAPLSSITDGPMLPGGNAASALDVGPSDTQQFDIGFDREWQGEESNPVDHTWTNQQKCT